MIKGIANDCCDITASPNYDFMGTHEDGGHINITVKWSQRVLCFSYCEQWNKP